MEYTWDYCRLLFNKCAIFFVIFQPSDAHFLYSQLGRVVIKRHTYLTPVTHATYPWNHAHPPGRKSAFKMPKTVYPKRWQDSDGFTCCFSHETTSMLTIRCSDHHWLVLQISGRSRPSDKSGGGGGVIQTQRWGGGWSPKNIFWPFGPHFGLRIRGGGRRGGTGLSPGSVTANGPMFIQIAMTSCYVKVFLNIYPTSWLRISIFIPTK